MVSAAQRNFGRRLRDQRERAQIALSEIAEATKIKRSLLEELERGEVSAWPGGIFRRAFVRARIARRRARLLGRKPGILAARCRHDHGIPAAKLSARVSP